MKLVRCVCRDCGFETEKARIGYHAWKWYFPVYATQRGQLTDEECVLPDSAHKRINSLTMELYTRDVRKNPVARAAASQKISELTTDVYAQFIRSEHERLKKAYAGSSLLCLLTDELVQVEADCPKCNTASLELRQVVAMAYCKPDCGHEYTWLDSEEKGCPQCEYRPHGFATEVEPRYADQPRIQTACPCSSTMISGASLDDAFCPKCGALPTSYVENEKTYCWKHREQQHPYRLPGWIFFSPIPEYARLFENAKIYGDAEPEEDSLPASYCESCQRELQAWLKENPDRD